MPDLGATFRGAILTGAKRWFATGVPPGYYDLFLGTLPPEDRVVWQNERIVPDSRLPASVYQHMYETITRLWGEDFFMQCAGAIAFQDLGAIMKIFIKYGTPAFTLRGFPTAYRHYFSQGEFQVENQDRQAARCELNGAQAFGRAGCIGTLGWTRMALEYAGANGVRAAHPECLYRGGSRCLLVYQW